VARLRIYANESVPVAVAEGLRRRQADAWSARDSEHLGCTDLEQLEYACRERAVIFTHDPDFLRIAKEWSEEGKEHWGILYVHREKLTVGECIRRLVDYATILEAEDMRTRSGDPAALLSPLALFP
jgi:Domain of unknown function (DUF5615)